MHKYPEKEHLLFKLTGSITIFYTDSNPTLCQFLVHSVHKTHTVVVTVELIWLLLLNIFSFNFFLQLPAVIMQLFRTIFICVIYFYWSHLCWNGVKFEVGKQIKRCEIVTQKSIKAKSSSYPRLLLTPI